jgi:hypothetical protein
MRSEEAQRWIDAGDETEARLTASRAVFVKAVKAVIEASQEYLPPDGISKDEFINRVLGATDNAEIVTALKEIEDDEARVAAIVARYPRS